MVPLWLQVLAWTYLAVCFGCAAVILVDVVRGYRQRMAVMEWVWPITALYLGPLALWGYVDFGRAYSRRRMAERGGMPVIAHWKRVALSTSHCGAGCTLGDIVAEWLIFALAITIAGSALYASFVFDYAFAFALGLVFQFFAIRQMGERSPAAGAVRALKTDFISLTAFEVGLFAWMAFVFFTLVERDDVTPASPTYWFMMQLGMILGFLTSFPANAWMIRRGLKDAM